MPRQWHMYHDGSYKHHDGGDVLLRMRPFLACAAMIGTAVCAVGPVNADYSVEFGPADRFSYGVPDKVVFSSAFDGLTLATMTESIPYLWVPSAPEGAVRKVNARTGEELGRYSLGSQHTPCAVATDPMGNAYVACGRGDSQGSVLRIRSASSTSGDVVEVVTDLEAWPSCVTFDENGYLWVGLWSELSVAKIDVRSGRVIARVPLVGRPTNALADSRGTLWVLCGSSRKLCRVSALTCAISDAFNVDDPSASGLCLGDDGRLWIGASKGILCFDTQTEAWSKHNTPDESPISSIAVDTQGEIWGACPSRNALVHFLGDCGDYFDSTTVGCSPNSVCIDDDGLLWTLNEGSDTATRVDPATGKCVGAAKVGSSPFSTTPFVGTVIRSVLADRGSWSTVLDSRAKDTTWRQISWKSGGMPGATRVEARVADDRGLLKAAPFTAVENGVSMDPFPGRFLELRVTFSGDGKTSPVLRWLRAEGSNAVTDQAAAADREDTTRAPENG